MRFYLIAFFVLMGGVFSNSHGQFTDQQNNAEKEYTELVKLLDKMQEEIKSTPINIKRVALFKLDFDEDRFTKRGVQYIRNEIERVINDYSGMMVINVTEFEEPEPLQIIGSDSSLTISNSYNLNGFENEKERLAAIADKYSLDAYMEGTLQYRPQPGYILSLRLIRADSREVVWSKNLISNDLRPQKKKTEAKNILFSAGGGLVPHSAYAINGQAPNGDPLIIDYSGNLTVRQSINSTNSGYLGVSIGFHQYRAAGLDEGQNTDPFSLSSFRVGVLYYLSLAEKKEIPNDYWVEVYLGPDMLVISENDNLFRINQGINFNLAKNLGIAVDLQYLLSSEPSLDDANSNTNVQFKSIGYALRFLVRL